MRNLNSTTSLIGQNLPVGLAIHITLLREWRVTVNLKWLNVPSSQVK